MTDAAVISLGVGAPSQVPENPGPIVGAGSRDILEGATTLPNMRSALVGWNRPITFEIVTTRIVEGESSETRRPISTTGTMQPMKARRVELKPEGQRAWRWWTLHTVSDIALKVDDRVILKGVPYRVMGTSNFQDMGFFKYELVEDYNGR